MSMSGRSRPISTDITPIGTHFRNKKAWNTQLWEIKAFPQRFSFSHFGEGEGSRGEGKRKKQTTSSLLPLIAEKEMLLKTPSPGTAPEQSDGHNIKLGSLTEMVRKRDQHPLKIAAPSVVSE